MSQRFTYLRSTRLPELPRTQDAKSLEVYRRDLSRALADWYRQDQRVVRELDGNPAFCASLITTSQSIAANAVTPVELNNVTIDSHSWWDAFTYTPQEPGFYRCSWTVNLHDSAEIAADAYGYSLLDGTDVSFQGPAVYGNATAFGVTSGGSAIVECNGSTTAIQLKAFLSAGTAPTVLAATPARTWLAIDYIGRQQV